MSHSPVMVKEVLAHLALRPGDVVVDATVGGGGHAQAALEATAPDGVLLAIDRDPAAIEEARLRLQPFRDRIRWIVGDYGDLEAHLAATGLRPAAILVDCGLSSLQLDDPTRGFSFQRDGPLDMRYARGDGATAADLVNGEPEERLADWFFRYGEEPAARRIARSVGSRRRRRPFERTSDLAVFVAQCVGRRGRIHPATRVFQALRIVVNDELGRLERFLSSAARCVAPEGRVAVIAFHSLEDRCVKRAFREGGRQGLWRVLTPKPVRPTEREREENPRARSAKLRVVERCGPSGARERAMTNVVD